MRINQLKSNGVLFKGKENRGMLYSLSLTLSKWSSRNEKCSDPQSHQKKKLQSPKPFKFKIKSEHSFLAYMHMYIILSSLIYKTLSKWQILMLRKCEKGEKITKQTESSLNSETF